MDDTEGRTSTPPTALGTETTNSTPEKTPNTNVDSSPKKLSRVSPEPGTPEEKLSGQNVFEELVNACTFKGTLKAFKRLCEALNIDPSRDHRQFYYKLSSLVLTWRAKHLWSKLSKRASDSVYQKGNAAINSRVLIIGAGPCGLRTAIECAFLGAKVVLIEKRDAFTRNNVLHLWDVVIRDLNSLGAKKLYKKFCISSIDHISIRQLQLILLKIALLLGVEIHHSVSFEDVTAPESEHEPWKAKVSCPDQATQTRLNEYGFDVLIGADGRRNSFADFKRYANRAKLAIAITANFKNGHTNEENAVQEIAGVTSYAKPELFQKLAKQQINLENIVYYKDATHYFIMTAHKSSLLERGVLLSDHSETDVLLSEANINQEELLKFAQDAAGVATDNQLPLTFAKNHYNQPDVAMFDFTSMYYADHGARIYKKNGRFLLKIIVGDSLIEPFWPTGSGIGKGFLSSFDAAWSVKNWCSGLCSVNQILSEHEASYKSLFSLLSSDKLKSLPAKQFYPLDPYTRYPSLSMPSMRDVKRLFISDEIEALEESQGEVLPQKQLDYNTLLHWVQKTLLKCQTNYSDFVRIEDLTESWRDTRGFAVLLHIFQPELINIDKAKGLLPDELAQLVFSKLPAVGIFPGFTHTEFISEVPDQLSVLSILVPMYHRFHDALPASQLPKYNKIVDNNSEISIPANSAKSGDERKARANHHHRQHHHHRNTSAKPTGTFKNGDSNIPLFARESSTPPKGNKNQKPSRKLDLTDNKWIESLNDDVMSSSLKTEKVAPRTRRALKSVGGSGDVGELSDNSSSPSKSPAKANQKKPGAEKVKCLYCKEDVLMLDRMLLESHYFHRSCFRCIYCKKVLTEKTYSYFKSEDGVTNHFYCSTHHRWRTEGYIGPPNLTAEKLPGIKPSGSAGTDRKKSGLASLLTDIPIQQAVRPVERIQIEVSTARPATKKELTEEEMSDFNYGPGYQTAENNSDASSDEASDFAPNFLLDSAVLSPDAFANWREMYSARKFSSNVTSAADDKSKGADSAGYSAKSKRKQVESEDDADDEGDTEIEKSEGDEDSGTEVENRNGKADNASSDESLDTSSVDTAHEVSEGEPQKALKQNVGSPTKRKSKPPRVKLPISATMVHPEDSETEVEGDKNKDVKRRRARRPRPTKERVMKVNPSFIRIKTEVQPEPMSLDVLLGNNKTPEKAAKDHNKDLDDTSPDMPTAPQSSIVHRREVIKVRSNFLEAQQRPEVVPSKSSEHFEPGSKDNDSNVGEVFSTELSKDEKLTSSKKDVIQIDDEPAGLRKRSEGSTGSGTRLSSSVNRNQEEIVKKTLDYIPQSSALSLMQQLDQTYKQFKREDKPPPQEPLKQVRIVTPPPEDLKSKEEKPSPPVPAFDPRVNMENSVRKALGSKSREEERRDRKAKLANLKASHFGAAGSSTGTEVVKSVSDSAKAPELPAPLVTPVPAPISFKMTTYMSKEFTKLPGSNVVNVENKFSNAVHIPLKTGLAISKDTAQLVLKQNAVEVSTKNQRGETIEQHKSIDSSSYIKPGSQSATNTMTPSSDLQSRALGSPKRGQLAIQDSKTTAKPVTGPSASHTRSSSSSVAFPQTFKSTSSTIDSVKGNGNQRPKSVMPAESKSSENPFELSPGSESALSGFLSDGNAAASKRSPDSSNVKHTKLNSTVKVTLFETPSASSKPKPILSYRAEDPSKKSTNYLTDTEKEDNGVLSDTAQVKSPKTGSLKFFKKFKPNFSSSSSEKEAKLSKLKHLKSTPSLAESAKYFDEQVEKDTQKENEKGKTLGALSPNMVTSRKDKKSFASHFKIRSSTLKNDKSGSMPSKDETKSDSKLGIKSAGSSNASSNSNLHAKTPTSPVSDQPTSPTEKRTEKKSEAKSKVTGKDVMEDDDSTLVEEKQTVAKDAVVVESTPKPLPIEKLEQTAVDKGDEKKEAEVRSNEKSEDKRPETPPATYPENNSAAQLLKSNRKARQSKNREKIKQMQLKLGLKNLPGTLETKIDSITDFCGGRRTSGVNKDLDDLYNEVASSEKGLPYYKQTDLRRSMEKLTDRKLQSFEILIDEDSSVQNNKNGKTNGVENGQREREIAQMELIAKRMENLEHVSRCQNLERVSREIEEKELLMKSISQRGEMIEKSLMDKKLKKKDKSDLTQKWVEVKQELDSMAAGVAELVYSREQLILDVRHYNLKQEIRDLMNVSDQSKSESQVEREKQLLQEIIEVVEEKNQLVQKLDTERIHEEQVSDAGGLPDTLASNSMQSTGSLKSKRKIKTMFNKK